MWVVRYKGSRRFGPASKKDCESILESFQGSQEFAIEKEEAAWR